MSATVFYGKYRGVVSANEDPLMAGRIKARVPDVLGDRDSPWASACVSCGFTGAALPEIGARVWIEFEGGDPVRPIWTGCWWPDPADAADPSGNLVVATAAGHTILIDETPGGGGITIRAATGASVSVTGSGIVIDNGAGARITLIGPRVSVNNGALDIT